MNKKTKYAISGGLIGGAAFGISNVFKQLKNNDPQKPFNWEEFFTALLSGTAIGSVTGFAIGAYKDYQNANEKPLNTDEAIFLFLNKIRLNKSDKDYQVLCSKSNWLVQVLRNEFQNQLRKIPYRFGSTEKGTALKENFDIDICLPFKPDVFSSTANMYYVVIDTLKKYIGINDIIDIREQKKSIGIFFLLGNTEYKIDILPQKITKAKGNYSSGYLYVNNKGLFEKPSRTKTDIDLLNSINLSETQKKILVLLKEWKRKNQIPISSHLLQYLILDAYYNNKGGVPKSIARKTIMVLRYIKENIEGLTLSSIENTNNILTDISASDKAFIAKACNEIIQEFEYQPNSILKTLL